MESVFRLAREKLEKEHIERKEIGKLKLQQENKAKDAAERQRQAVEASQRARRLEAIEAKMKVEDNLGEETEDVKHKYGDSSMQVLPPCMDRQGMKMRQEENVDNCGSDEDSRLQNEYRKAYFAALLNQQGVAEEEDEDDVE